MTTPQKLTPKQQEFLFRAKAKLKERELGTQEIARRLAEAPEGVRRKYGSVVSRLTELERKARKLTEHMAAEVDTNWSDTKKDVKRVLKKSGRGLRKLKWRVPK